MIDEIAKLLDDASLADARRLQLLLMNSGNTSKDTGFPERLRQLRKEKELSQTELGNIAGLHYTHIGRYERGGSFPTADSLRRLADALGVSADYLLHGNTQEAAKANFSDRELLLMFQEIEKLPDEDKIFIKRVVDALLTKIKVKALAKTG